MTDMERILEIDAKVRELKEEIQTLEEERKGLMDKMEGEKTKILNELPSRVKLAFSKAGVTTDMEMLDFLDGYWRKEQYHYRWMEYRKANTYFDRLCCLSGIGRINAHDALTILKEKHFIIEE